MTFIVRTACAFASVCLLATAPQKSDAQEEIVLEAAKAAATAGISMAVNWGVEKLYDATCDGAVNNSDFDDWVCASMGSFTGRDEAEFRQAVEDGLAQLQESAARIEDGLKHLSEGQAQIISALQLVDKKIDAIPTEVDAQKAVREIRVLWNNRFSKMGSSLQPFTPAENVKLAKEIVANSRVHIQLGVLNDALTGPSLGGKASWLVQQMDLILAGTQPGPGADIQAPYALYRTMMERLLTEYARGETMYVWAARVLDADCAAGVVASCNAVPMNLPAFRAMAKSHRSAQLTTFITMVERLVLTASDPHSLRANFLNSDAMTVLTQADYFMALNDADRAGLRGRVISAGDAFAGTMTLSGTAHKAITAPRAFGTGLKIDWWQRSTAGKPYDILHFASGWKVYDFAIANPGTAALTRDAALPWTSGPIQMFRFDRRTGNLADANTPQNEVLEFGTFTAIARAGGAYAMMTDAWNLNSGGSANYGHISGTSTAPELTAYRSGKVIYASKSPFDFSLRYNEGTVTPWLERKSPVTFADGGAFIFHGIFADSGYLHPRARNGKLPGGIKSRTTLQYSTDFNNVIKDTIKAKLELSAMVNLRGLRGNRPLQWFVNKFETADAVKGTVEHDGSKTFNLNEIPPGTQLTPRMSILLYYYMPVSGINATNYELFAGIAPKALYFTRD